MKPKTVLLLMLMPFVLVLGMIIGSKITEGRIAVIQAENAARIVRLGSEIRNLEGRLQKAMDFLMMEGVASWYGYPFHGRPTSSGKIFDKDKLTAAHKTLPFGTFWRVKNNLNGKEVVIEIMDRGPFIPGRILDLSEAAAITLDMRRVGVCRVMMEPVLRVGTGD
jgi:rare lipoprotein A (peptidoglycan hydrolase)